MSRIESDKALNGALKDMPDSLLLVYKAGDQFKIQIVGGIEVHYMRDLLSAQLNTSIQQQIKRDGPPLHVLSGDDHAN